MKKIIFLTASLAIALESSGGLFDPSNYEDCVLDGVKDAKNEAAVGAVYQMCRRKFPPKTQKNELNIKGRLVCETLNHNNKTISVSGIHVAIRKPDDQDVFGVGLVVDK